MSDLKVSELPIAGTLLGTEAMVVVQDAETRQVSLDTLLAVHAAALIPSGGTWSAGQRIRNSAPAAGKASGWVCVASGTPGSWLPEGFLHAAATVVTAAAASILVTHGATHVDYATAAVITLPALAAMSGYDGKEFFVKDVGGLTSDAEPITFAPGVGTTVEDTYTLASPFAGITWYLDGTVWRAK